MATTTTTTKKSPKSAAKKVAKKATKKTAKKAANSKPRDNKTQHVLSMLRSAKGATRAQVLEHTGWKAVSIQQLVTSAGLDPDKDLKISAERPFSYRITK